LFKQKKVYKNSLVAVQDLNAASTLSCQLDFEITDVTGRLPLIVICETCIVF